MAAQYKRISIDQLTVQIKESDRIYVHTNLFGYLRISKRKALVHLYNDNKKPIKIKIVNILSIRKLYIKQ